MEKILFLYKEMKVGGAEKVILDTANVLNKESNVETIIATKNSTDIGIYKKNNLKLYEVPFNRVTPINLLKCLRKLYNICKKEKVTIIHSHHRLTTIYALIIGRVLKIKVVHTEHNVFPDKNKINLRGKNIIAVSKNVKDNLILNGVKEEYITVIYNGIEVTEEVEQKSIKDELGIDKGIFCFGVIARLSEQKGIKFLIESYKIMKENIDSRIILIGDGELKDELKELVKLYNLEEKIFFLGQRSDVKNIIKSLDCYILPSLYEGFPVTNLEIMMNKKIVIATDVGGNSEIIKDKVNGFLIESQNKNELIEVMNYVLENKDILKEMQEEAYKTIHDKFNITNVSKEYIKYYQDLKGEE